MRRILLYGDSNTWGFQPGRSSRFEEAVRWPGVLAAALGSDYRIIEEGLNGRTTVFDDPFEEGKNGKTYLGPCLQSHHPLELVVLMLGTNDLKHRFGLSAFDISEGIRHLAELVLMSSAGPGESQPQLLLIAPPHLNPEGLGEAFEGGLEKSKDLGKYYLKIAQDLGCSFVDAAAVVSSSPLDGVHLEKEAHQALGLAVAERVNLIFGESTVPVTDVELPNALPGSLAATTDGSIAVEEVRAAPIAAVTPRADALEHPNSLTPEEQDKVQAMHASIGKLTTALAQRGKGEEAMDILAEQGFTDGTTDLALGRQVYSVLRELLKGSDKKS